MLQAHVTEFSINTYCIVNLTPLAYALEKYALHAPLHITVMCIFKTVGNFACVT